MSDDTWTRLVEAHNAAQAEPCEDPPRHEPTAAILACSDARVPPSVLFDQLVGSLFVVRIAGNTANPAAVASLDYAVDVLGVDLIVVLGHTNCGAVQAAVDGVCGGHLAPVVNPICELRDAMFRRQVKLDGAGTAPELARTMPEVDPDRLTEQNVAKTVNDLANHPGLVGQAAAAGRLQIRGAIHDLRSGQLTPVATLNHNQTPSPVEAS
ncbi:MAG: carbonic anhydrase [Acidimicrobiales bacterium]